MKNLIISILCLAFLLVPWWFYGKHTDAAVEEYRDILVNTITPAIESGDWDTAKASFLRITSDWDDLKGLSAYFIDTNTVNEVDLLFTETSSYILQHDGANALAGTACLERALYCMCNDEMLLPGNVF